MRIDLSPERVEEARRSLGRAEGRRATQPLISIPKPRPIAAAGGADFQQLLQNIYDAVLITDLNGEVVLANARANQFFIALPGQLSRYSILALMGGADASLLPTILETLKANRFVLLQAYCVRTDGSFFAAEVSVNRLRLAEKDHLSFFIRDHTLRKLQEERLRTGHTALQNSSSGIIIAGLDGQIEFANAALIALVGLRSVEQVRAHNLREFLAQPEGVAEMLATTATGQAWSGEVEMQRGDGSIFFAQASVASNTNSEGEQTGLVFSVLDITTSKLAQQQLQSYAAELRTRNTEFQEDLNLASELHRAFLPAGFTLFPPDAEPDQAWLRISNLYRPCGTIGGDFYAVRALSAYEVGFFLADVMGHGIRPALVVATLRGLIEQLQGAAADPGAFMTQLNAAYSTIFRRISGDVIFATAFYAVIDTRNGELRWANASHPRPYLLRREEERCEQLAPDHNVRTAPLGVFAATRYPTRTQSMAAGDLLLLHTDGLTEVENAAGELYETERFPQALEECLHCPADQLLAFLSDDARAFSGKEMFEDDICLLGVELAHLAQGVPQAAALA